MLADPKIQIWEKQALEKLTEETNVEISLVVVNQGTYGEDDTNSVLENPRGIGFADLTLLFKSIKEERFWTLVHIERKLAWMIGGPSRRWELTKKQSVEEVKCLSNADIIYSTPIPTRDPWVKLPEETIKYVRENSDVAIRFGFGLIEGDILEAPNYGVLSFHPADIRDYRGLGPSLAYLNNDKKAGVTLQRLDDSVDAGEIIAFGEVNIAEAHTLDNVVGRINERAIDLLPEGIKNLQNPDYSPIRPEIGDYNTVSSRYSPKFAGKIFFKNIWGRMTRGLKILMDSF